MSAGDDANPKGREADDELMMDDRGEVDELQMDGNEVLAMDDNEAVDETLLDGGEIIDDTQRAAKPRMMHCRWMTMTLSTR